ncbi:MAG: hypothetical protein P4L22_01360 [Candidatus Babeliales bacterium]|nr:hypothetical protein [Candidatus Babeliales bacterium]
MKKLFFSLILGLGLCLNSFNAKADIKVQFTIPSKAAYIVPALFYSFAALSVIPYNNSINREEKKESLKFIAMNLLYGGISNLVIYKLLNK